MFQTQIDKDLIVDVDKYEEDYKEGEGATDFPIAKISGTENYTLMQLDGKMQPELVKKSLEMADKACEEIDEIQKSALKAIINGDKEK